MSAKYVWQWFWDHDWLGNKYKAIYFGPRLDWMKLFRTKNEKEKNLDSRKIKRSKKITTKHKRK